MQKHVNLVDLVKSFPTNMYLQNLASIQKRTSPLKFAHMAGKSEYGSISNLSTEAVTDYAGATGGQDVAADGGFQAPGPLQVPVRLAGHLRGLLVELRDRRDEFRGEAVDALLRALLILEMLLEEKSVFLLATNQPTCFPSNHFDARMNNENPVAKQKDFA